MASYTIEWKRSAVKELKQLPQDAIARIVKAVEQLSANPYPAGVKKLIGSEHTYRLRVGTYRVVYTLQANVLVIIVIRVGHRKDVYR
ncbi:MAG TPA: type II toxin-antitoxin system RelE/ParE family toxin [Anaerolineae bacterium]|nr:type II toxin-antitoxin system RelE/ParE family toxin [Anaerolineae bacterium]HQK13133.1 type II toxin-antitoxin system RelE/ParE family toxin [Anaerolineae bacterium]